MSTLSFTRKDGESWYDAGERYAKEHGLSDEFKDSYTAFFLDKDLDTQDATFEALAEWDLLDYDQASKRDWPGRFRFSDTSDDFDIPL